jgi:hypothetical protein
MSYEVNPSTYSSSSSEDFVRNEQKQVQNYVTDINFDFGKHFADKILVEKIS